MSEETNFIGADEDSASIGAIEGYPETGNNSWRADNDQAFIDACNNYNEKYGLSEGDDGYVSPKMLKAWAMVESGGSPEPSQQIHYKLIILVIGMIEKQILQVLHKIKK